MADNTITLGEIKGALAEQAQTLLAAYLKANPAAGPAPAVVKQAQETAVEATIDGKPVKATMSDGQTDMGRRSANVLGGLDTLKIMNFELGPVGSIIAGSFVGAITARAVDLRFAPRGAPTVTDPTGPINFINPAIHAAAMVGYVTYGAGFLGKQAAYFAAAGHLMTVLFNYTPLGQWIADIANRLGGVTTGAQSRAQQIAAAQASHQLTAARQTGSYAVNGAGHRDQLAGVL